jgi:hypothetical protein
MGFFEAKSSRWDVFSKKTRTCGHTNIISTPTNLDDELVSSCRQETVSSFIKSAASGKQEIDTGDQQ